VIRKRTHRPFAKEKTGHGGTKERLEARRGKWRRREIVTKNKEQAIFGNGHAPEKRGLFSKRIDPREKKTAIGLKR